MNRLYFKLEYSGFACVARKQQGDTKTNIFHPKFIDHGTKNCKIQLGKNFEISKVKMDTFRKKLNRAFED